MNTTLLNAMTAALLTTACLTAFADPPKKHNRISTVSEPSSYQSSTSAAEHEVAADSAQGHIQAVGRSGSHSMHPKAPVAAEQFADDNVQHLLPTAEQSLQVPGSN